MLCIAFFLFCSFFNRVMFLFFFLSFLSFCSLLLCFLFSQIFTDTVLFRHWFFQMLVGCSFFFLLSDLVFLPYFCNFAFFRIFFLVFTKCWFELVFVVYFFALFSVFFLFFFFNFLVVCFSSFFVVGFLFVLNLLLFLKFLFSLFVKCFPFFVIIFSSLHLYWKECSEWDYMQIYAQSVRWSWWYSRTIH